MGQGNVTAGVKMHVTGTAAGGVSLRPGRRRSLGAGVPAALTPSSWALHFARAPARAVAQNVGVREGMGT